MQMLTVRVCFPIKALIQINLNDHTQCNVEQGGPFAALSSSLPCSILPLFQCLKVSFFHPVASLIVSITSSVHQCNSAPPPTPPAPPPSLVISHHTFLRHVSKQPMLNVEKVNGCEVKDVQSANEAPLCCRFDCISFLQQLWRRRTTR